jgi:two-component system, cell cycle sensor histidine kinase and response regulator CckA
MRNGKRTARGSPRVAKTRKTKPALGGATSAPLPVDADAPRLLEELRTHQIELQMQNEELRRVQENLLEARDRMADLYDSAPVGYVTWDGRGVVEEANLTMAAMLGVTRTQLIARPLSAFVAAKDADLYEKFRRNLARAAQREVCQLAMRKLDGVEFYTRVEAVPVSGAEHEASAPRFRAAVSDITAHVVAEESLRQASRMEATATLAGGIAHDFNNLMTAVLGYVELARSELADKPATLQKLSGIAYAARKAADLARLMLAYARGGKNRPCLLNLNETIRDVLKLQNVIVPPEVSFEQDLEPDLWMVNADRTQASQVVMNLCANALEALDAKGVVAVRTANLEVRDDSPRPLADMPSGDYVSLSVRDSGRGMDSDTCARVFEPFFSTKAPGRGLGLAAVFGIVKNHGGHVTVASRPYHGTIFTIYLPALRAPSGPRDAQIAHTAAAGNETILVVDDEDSTRDIVRCMLERLGYTILLARNGAEAVELARAHAGAIDLALLDLHMPVMGGDEALPLLLDARPGLRVIIFSGSGIPTPSGAPNVTAAFPYLEKPFCLEILAKEIRRVLGNGKPA